MNPAALLKMLGFNPDELLGEVENFRALANAVEARVTAIEEKQDRIIALLEGLHDNAAESLQTDHGRVDSSIHHELTVINGAKHERP
jgi:hypothetical protein